VNAVRHGEVLSPCALGALFAPGSSGFSVNADRAELARAMIQSPRAARPTSYSFKESCIASIARLNGGSLSVTRLQITLSEIL
jgi:hypothetical protein